MYYLRFFYFSLFLYTASYVHAAELTTVEINENKGNYHVNIVAIVKADADTVKQIIQDYENLPDINPYLIESKTLQSTESVKTVSMLTEVCVLFLCYQVRHVQEFRETDKYRIEALVLPAQSDLSAGWTRWEISPIDNQQNATTEIRMEAEMTPDFFVLPFIGPYQMKRMIVKITTSTIENLERKARGLNLTE